MSSSLFACATDNINAISTQRTADHVASTPVSQRNKQHIRPLSSVPYRL